MLQNWDFEYIMRKPMIKPELSSQGIKKHPNPMLTKVFAVLPEIKQNLRRESLVVDFGCGQLRNVQTLLSISSKLILVDTSLQLSIPHEFYGKKMLIRDFVDQYWPKKNIRVLSFEEFSRTPISADLIFSINVFDVVPKEERYKILVNTTKKLKDDGLFVLIASRNDTWTLRICTPKNKYQDGYIFPHPKGYTYYKNWPKDMLHKEVTHFGLSIVKDMSIYRHVCLICKNKCN